MKLPLLYIRYKQFCHELNALGLYLLLLLPIAGYIMYCCFFVFRSGQKADLLIAGLVSFCAILQYYRKDKRFVYKHIDSPHLQLFSEYVAVTFPFSAMCLFTNSWYLYLVLLACLFCLPFFHSNIQPKVFLKNLSSVIPPSNIEWLSGIRKQFFPIVILYLLAFAFCWFNMLPLFLLWFLTVLLTSFYTESESIQVLREGAPTPRELLLRKWKVCTNYVILLYTPILLVNTICHVEYLFVNLLFIPTQLALLYFGITLKYASYRPNKSHHGNQIPLAIVSMCSVLPYLIPIPAILSIVYFYKAKDNLKKYLHD